MTEFELHEFAKEYRQLLTADSGTFNKQCFHFVIYWLGSFNHDVDTMVKLLNAFDQMAIDSAPPSYHRKLLQSSMQVRELLMPPITQPHGPVNKRRQLVTSTSLAGKQSRAKAQVNVIKWQDKFKSFRADYKRRKEILDNVVPDLEIIQKFIDKYKRHKGVPKTPQPYYTFIKNPSN